jgi:hypothetical protein
LVDEVKKIAQNHPSLDWKYNFEMNFSGRNLHHFLVLALVDGFFGLG